MSRGGREWRSSAPHWLCDGSAAATWVAPTTERSRCIERTADATAEIRTLDERLAGYS
ncbi:hypothetical protein [Streptomyces sp. NPDC002845]